MTQTTSNYARVLYELQIELEYVEEVKEIITISPELFQTLKNPVISLEIKHELVDSIFSSKMVNFIKVLCDNGDIGSIQEIFAAFKDYYNDKEGIMEASLYFVTLPDEKQVEDMKTYLCQRYGKKEIQFSLIEKSDLIGGFVIRAKDQEIDWSMRGRINELQRKLVWR